jgi:hypothetical protein
MWRSLFVASVYGSVQSTFTWAVLFVFRKYVPQPCASSRPVPCCRFHSNTFTIALRCIA